MLDYGNFTKEIDELGSELRRNISKEDFKHLKKLQRFGRAYSLLGYGTAWILPNPLSAFLIAQSMMIKFTIGHHIGHGAYDNVPNIPERYTSKKYAHGWKRFIDWPDWWNHTDWLYTHNKLHHPNTQAPLDADIMNESSTINKLPMWLRYFILILSLVTWKFSYYTPRMHKELSLKNDGVPRTQLYDFKFTDVSNIFDPVVRTLWLRDYFPYILFRFVLPPLIALPLGIWAATNILLNMIFAELLHNAQTFICIRPSHCASDIPLFKNGFRNREEFYLQSVLGTVNYHSGGNITDSLQGWTNYQIEHHLWPKMTLLKYQQARPKLVEICRRNHIPYKEENVLLRFWETSKLFLGLEHQSIINTQSLLDFNLKKPLSVKET